MVLPNNESASGMKLRIRNKKPFYKSWKLRYSVPLVLTVIILITLTTGDDFIKIRLSSSLASTIQLLSTPECQNTKHLPNTRKRWSNRFTGRSISTVQSIFNCDLPNSTCQYYFPANFFDEKCGIGGRFAYHIADAESMRKNETLWTDMPSVGFPTLTMNNVCLDKNSKGRKRQPGRMPERDEKGGTGNASPILTDIGEHNLLSKDVRCLTERISFIHVHKSGGTSLHSSFSSVSRKSNATLTRHKWFTPKHTGGGMTRPQIVNKMKENEDGMYNFTLEAALQATTYPVTEFGEYDHVIFAVVRDPTERFISSIGQAMGGRGSTGNKIGKILQKECIKSTSALTLTCMAKYVRDHGFWIELHFSPQVIDISFTTIWQDIPIAVFSFKELKNILAYLAMPNARGRNGGSGEYRPNPVLSEMSVEDYNEESLRIVCEIYELDVIMQRSLGIAVPRCDPFIPQ